MTEFSHLDEEGRARMVDVGEKSVTRRIASASCRVVMQPATAEKIRQQQISKGDVLQTARIAGILAAKKTPDLIPLCHPLPLNTANIDFEFADSNTLVIVAHVTATAQTGVEMEALTAASVAALTIYDMCKSIDRSMTIQQVQLDEKQGGKSGHYQRKEDAK